MNFDVLKQLKKLDITWPADEKFIFYSRSGFASVWVVCLVSRVSFYIDQNYMSRGSFISLEEIKEVVEKGNGFYYCDKYGTQSNDMIIYNGTIFDNVNSTDNVNSSNKSTIDSILSQAYQRIKREHSVELTKVEFKDNSYVDALGIDSELCIKFSGEAKRTGGR